MPSFLAPYRILVYLVVLAAIGFGVNLFLNYEQNIGYQKAVSEYNVKLIAAKDDARAQEKAWGTRLQESQNVANEEINARDARLAALSVATGGLRGTVATLRDSLSSATLDACRTRAAALAAVFDECQVALGEMGRAAEGHAIDSLMYQTAWPK